MRKKEQTNKGTNSMQKDSMEQCTGTNQSMQMRNNQLHSNNNNNNNLFDVRQTVWDSTMNRQRCSPTYHMIPFTEGT